MYVVIIENKINLFRCKLYCSLILNINNFPQNKENCGPNLIDFLIRTLKSEFYFELQQNIKLDSMYTQEEKKNYNILSYLFQDE